MVRKAVVDAKTFSSALDQVSKVLRKSSIPVLAEALVSISDGQCTLTATDMETYLFQTVRRRPLLCIPQDKGRGESLPPV